MRIDWTKDDNEILERFKTIYPEQSEEKLRENIKYQKLIFEATSKRTKKH